jgi:hypothetical protein
MLSTWISFGLLLVSLASLGAAGYIWWQSRRYTRDRFAFAGLTALTTLTALAMATFGGLTPWDVALAVFNHFVPGHVPPSSSSTEGVVLTFLLVAIVAFAIVQIHHNWTGPITEAQAERDRLEGKAGLVTEGAKEFLRLLKNHPSSKIYQPGRSSAHDQRLEGDQENAVFRDLVRDAFCERYPDITIDPGNDWHHQGGFWLGLNKRLGTRVSRVLHGGGTRCNRRSCYAPLP